MQFLGLGIVLAVFAVIFFTLGVRVLLKGPWLRGLLRGTLGLLGVAQAGLIGLIAYDLYAYQEQELDQPIATIAVQTYQPGQHRITLSAEGSARNFLLDGDLWKLDVRLLKWSGLADLIGLNTGYRLDSMHGRFLTIEQQNAARNLEQNLADSLLGVDVWHWLRQRGQPMLFAEAQTQSVSFIPITDDARYSVEWLPTGLIVKPLNSVAEKALKEWGEP